MIDFQRQADDLQRAKAEILALKTRVNTVSTGQQITGSTPTTVPVLVWTNATGATAVSGEVVVLIPGTDRSFNTTTTDADPLVIGVVDEVSIPDGGNGRVKHLGYHSALQTWDAVPAGHYLKASTHAGYAVDAGTDPVAGVFGIAITATVASGASTVAAMVFPVVSGAGSSLPPPGDDGQVLTLVSGSPAWADVPDDVDPPDNTWAKFQALGDSTAGIAVIASPPGDYFDITSAKGDPRIIGILAEDVTGTDFGRVTLIGYQPVVQVHGAVAEGDFLWQSDFDNGIVESAGTVLKNGVFGIALNAFDGMTDIGTIDAYIFPVFRVSPYALGRVTVLFGYAHTGQDFNP